LKAAIEGRVCTHDSSLNSAGERRAGAADVTDPRQAPGAVHPLVRAHPVTAAPVLYLGRRRNAYVHGLPLAESEALLDRLWTPAPTGAGGPPWRRTPPGIGAGGSPTSCSGTTSPPCIAAPPSMPPAAA